MGTRLTYPLVPILKRATIRGKDYEWPPVSQLASKAVSEEQMKGKSMDPVRLFIVSTSF